MGISVTGSPLIERSRSCEEKSFWQKPACVMQQAVEGPKGQPDRGKRNCNSPKPAGSPCAVPLLPVPGPGKQIQIALWHSSYLQEGAAIRCNSSGPNKKRECNKIKLVFSPFKQI